MAIRRDIHRMALLSQRAPQQSGHPSLVLHHQHPHGQYATKRSLQES